ncbi:hypothetical protein DV736_g1823, partial [Chaetothyriales sp. CBS 134916]
MPAAAPSLPRPSPLLTFLIHAYLKRHGLKATSKALTKELVTAERGLSATEEEILENHSLDTILLTWQAFNSHDADDEDEAVHAKPKAHTKKVAAAPSSGTTAPATNSLKQSGSSSEAESDSSSSSASDAAAPVNAAASSAAKSDDSSDASDDGQPGPAISHPRPVTKEQPGLKDDDSAIVSSSSGTVVDNTKPAVRSPALKKKHEGARPTPLAALSASTTADSHISNAYRSYDYADRAYKDLSVTRGKGFTKEKNKKKRGSYRGGPIDISGGKSFRFDD